jgi:acetyl-CoA C-acetyltransferase
MPLLVYDEHGAVVSIIADDEAPVKFNHGNDEKARAAYEEKLRAWRPVYPGGVITPLNASRLSHGAAAMLVFTDDGIKKAKESFGVELKPQARITTIGRIYQEPERFPEVPYLLAQKYITGSAKYETLVETNEAFAPVPILVEREAGIEPRLHNIHGGAISRGHPLGASGAIILTRLLYNMERFSIQHGAVLICVGGGGGTALLVERV